MLRLELGKVRLIPSLGATLCTLGMMAPKRKAPTGSLHKSTGNQRVHRKEVHAQRADPSNAAQARLLRGGEEQRLHRDRAQMNKVRSTPPFSVFYFNTTEDLEPCSTSVSRFWVVGTQEGSSRAARGSLHTRCSTRPFTRGADEAASWWRGTAAAPRSAGCKEPGRTTWRASPRRGGSRISGAAPKPAGSSPSIQA